MNGKLTEKRNRDMPTTRTITQTLYTFEELSDRAKERARDWYRECSSHDQWWENCYEGMIEDLRAIGITVDKKHPFFFDCDRGAYVTFNKACIDDLDKLLQAACKHNRNVSRLYDTIANNIRIETTRYGRSEHQTVEIHFYSDERCPRISKAIDEITEQLTECLKDMEHKFIKLLRDELKYQYSAEYVDECITCNDYTFDENGKRLG